MGDAIFWCEYMTEFLRSNEAGIRIGLNRSEIIDKLYEVAVDPERYESLLDSWENRIGAIRDLANPALGFHDPELEAHFERADIFLDRLSETPDLDDPATALAQYENVAACLVDARLRIEGVNNTAHAIFGLSKGDKLSTLPLEDFDFKALSNAIAETVRDAATPARLFRFRSVANDRIIVFQLRPWTLAGKNMAIVATSEVGWPAQLDNTLKAAFQLSQTEVEVVRALVECQSLRTISELRGRSIETVRSQMRSILGKTETHSQSELVRITLSLMDVVGQTEAVSAALKTKAPNAAALEPRPYQSIQRPDGRRLDYVVLGHPDGSPVMFLPGDYGLIRWPASAEAAAKAQGLRVIVPIRAGFGHSSQLRSRDQIQTTLTEDFAAILDANEVKRCPIISSGSDSYFAFLFAARYPKRTRAIFAFGGSLPFTRPEQFDRMGKWHRFILANARYAPHLLPFMVKAGFFLARRIGKRGFVHAVYGDCPADVETFEHPEVMEAMITGSEVALSDQFNAHAAFSREVIAQTKSDWVKDVRAVREAQIPVQFVNGAQDPMIPPETLDDYRSDYPWIDIELHEDAGQLIFFKKWARALELLQKRF